MGNRKGFTVTALILCCSLLANLQGEESSISLQNEIDSIQRSIEKKQLKLSQKQSSQLREEIFSLLQIEESAMSNLSHESRVSSLPRKRTPRNNQNEAFASIRQSQHEVRFPANISYDYHISKNLVTIGEYIDFAKRQNRFISPRLQVLASDKKKLNRPVTYITYSDALAYARSRGARLPTAVELKQAFQRGQIQPSDLQDEIVMWDNVNYSLNSNRRSESVGFRLAR